MCLIACSFFCLHMNACISWREIPVTEGEERKGRPAGAASLQFLTCPMLVLLGLVWSAWKRHSPPWICLCTAAIPLHLQCHQVYLASRQSDYSCNFVMKLISWIEMESRAEEGKMLSPWLYKPLCIELSSLIIVGQSMKYHMMRSRWGVPWLCLYCQTCEFSRSHES